jgi:hypothetical protein
MLAILVALTALHAANALLLVERFDLVFTGWRRGTWRRRRGVELFVGRTGWLILRGAWPPLDPAIVMSTVRDARLDTASVMRQFERLGRHARALRALSNGLFAAIFVALPVAVFVPAAPITITQVLIVIGVLWAAAGVSLLRVRRRLYPVRGERPSVVAAMLSPVAMTNAVDVVARPLFAGCHPLAVARVVCRRDEYLRLARDHYYAGESADRDLAVAFLGAHRDLEDVTAPPPHVPLCVAYCPRCHSQFRVASTPCPDCLAPTLSRVVTNGAAPFQSVTAYGSRLTADAAEEQETGGRVTCGPRRV